MASVVSAPELCHFVQVNGAGGRAIAWIAGRQLGLITGLQLHLAGVGRGALVSRIAGGTLHRLHRGVYLVGHAIAPPGAPELAALLACGPGTLVSHRSAAGLWQLAPAGDGQVEITVVGRHCRTRPGLCVRRVGRLEPADRRVSRGITLTAPARTLIDFSARATPQDVERALGEAYARQLVTERQIVAAIDRAPNRAGTGALSAELRRQRGPRLTRSEGERELLKLILAARLPRPLTNVRTAGYEVDFLWASQQLVVEVDGFAFHGHRGAFERDRRKDMALVAAGHRVIRVTWRQIIEDPFVVVAGLARALDAK